MIILLESGCIQYACSISIKSEYIVSPVLRWSSENKVPSKNLTNIVIIFQI